MHPTYVLAHLQWSIYELEYGIRSYAREADWTLAFMRNEADYPHGSRKVDGLIVLAGPDKTDTSRLYPNAKTVDISDIDLYSSHCRVSSDAGQIARMAVDYLRSLGHTHFVTFTLKEVPPMSERVSAFHRILAESGIPCQKIVSGFWSEQAVVDPHHLQQRIREVFRSCQLPLAAFCPDDHCAESFIQAVLDLGYRVPKDVAVLGVNNSRDICPLSRVPISSIDMNFFRRGYESARVLERLMQGEELESRRIVIPPLTIVKRNSTEPLVETDKAVTDIQDYIRQHFAEKISVETLCRDLHLSRSSAFARFSRQVGHSIGTEITRTRMEYACHMLTTTDYKIDYVATMSGYQNTSSFCRIFKKLFHQTPIDYRNSNQEPKNGL